MKFNFFGGDSFDDGFDDYREERMQAKAQRKARAFCPDCGLSMRSHAMNCPNYQEVEQEKGEE